MPKEKRCYCHTCERAFNHHGIATHRWMHRRRGEECKITYSDGRTYVYHAPRATQED